MLENTSRRSRMSVLRKLLQTGKIRKVLAMVGEDEDLGADLIEFLEDADETTRRAAFEVVAQAGNFPSLLEALPMLIAGLESGEEDTCRFAAEALRHLGADAAEAADPLAALLDHDDDEVRRSAARALGAIGPAATGVSEQLIEALNDSDEVVRGEAALAIRNIGSGASEAVPHLVEMLLDEEEFKHNGKSIEVRDAAREALSRIGPKAIPGLLDALREDRADLRLMAVTTLGRMPRLPAEAMKDLEEAVSDPDEAVRDAARKVFKKTKSES
jgi:HEAT repeat protein